MFHRFQIKSNHDQIVSLYFSLVLNETCNLIRVMQSAAKNFDPKTSKVGKSAEEVTYFKCSKVSCSTKTVTSNDKKPFAYVIRYFSTFPCHIRNKPWR